MKRRGRCTLGDIFFLNSFAEDYSSAITALTKREAAQNWEQSVPSRLPFYISNGDFTASGARLWREGGGGGREVEEEEARSYFDFFPLTLVTT